MNQYYTPAVGFDQDDIDNLIIAIRSLRDKTGFLLDLYPSDILQDWFVDALEQYGAADGCYRTGDGDNE